MSIFEDMTTELASYPVTNVQLEFVEVIVPGTALNTNEFGTFRVKVTNTGPLVLTGVTVKVRGQNGAKVASNGMAGTFGAEVVTQELPAIGAHGGSQITVGGPLRFQAPAATQPSRTLLKATLESWDANLDHILNGHSDPLDPPRGVFSAEVVAQ